VQIKFAIEDEEGSGGSAEATGRSSGLSDLACMWTLYSKVHYYKLFIDSLVRKFCV